MPRDDAVPYYYGMNWDAPAGPAPPRPIGGLLNGAILQDQIGVNNGLWYQNVMGVPLSSFQIDFGRPKVDEGKFRQWYSRIAEKYGYAPDPDDPEHHYDYRGAFAAGFEPDETGHWPSKFKGPNHPNRIIDGVDTATGQKVMTSYHTLPEAVVMLADSMAGESVRSLMRVGKALTGDAGAYVVDEVNDPRTVALAQAKDVLEALSLYSGPGIIAGKPSATGLSVFGGLGAREAPVSMRKIAEVALAAGKHPEEVWKHTGWRKAADKGWRFEIDDKNMFIDTTRLNYGHDWTNTRQGARLKDVVWHEELFKQYPEIGNIEIDLRFGKNLEHKGHFNDGGKFGTPKIVVTGKDVNDARDVLVHEIQHWVQKKEGFAVGTNPGTPEVRRLAREEIASKVIPVLEQKIDAATDHKELQRLVSELSMLKSGQVPEDRAYDIYLRYHGEIEARDAAARRTWDKDMRREVFPTDREDAIIRFGKKEAEEIERELLR